MKIKIGELYEIYQKYGDLGFKVSTPYGYKNIEWCGITEKNADVYRCELENGMFVEGADYHRLKKTDNDFVYLKEIQKGEMIQTKEGDSPVVCIKLLEEKDTLYDVQVEEVHQYYTNGIVSHNTVLSVDLLMFLFFNTTTKTQKAEEIFNRFTDKDKVSVRGEITIDGEDYIIARTIERKKAKSGEWNVKTELDFFKKLADGQLQNFTGEQRRETEKFIKNSIGEQEDFLTTILTTATNLEDLLESKPTARGQVLTKFLGLEFLKKKEETGKELYSEFSKGMLSNVYNTEALKQQITDSELEIQRLEEEVKTANTNISEVSSRLTTGQEYKDNLLKSKHTDIPQELIIMNPSTIELEIQGLVNDNGKVKKQIDDVDVSEPKEYYHEDNHDEVKDKLMNTKIEKNRAWDKVEDISD